MPEQLERVPFKAYPKHASQIYRALLRAVADECCAVPVPAFCPPIELRNQRRIAAQKSRDAARQLIGIMVAHKTIIEAFAKNIETGYDIRGFRIRPYSTGLYTLSSLTDDFFGDRQTQFLPMTFKKPNLTLSDGYLYRIPMTPEEIEALGELPAPLKPHAYKKWLKAMSFCR